jgi:hypothetical protein
MWLYILESWILLVRFEVTMRSGQFQKLHQIVHETPVKASAKQGLSHREDICTAMDYACVLYFKRVLCLQRSCATTLLLRRHGWKAEMVIGAQLVPFKSHAWVEIEGAVVNDKPYVTEIFHVLERC